MLLNLMESTLHAMLSFMRDRVQVFFARRMLAFRKNVDIAAIESGRLAAVQGERNMLAWFANIIEFLARQILLHDVCESSGRAAAKKKQYRHQSHGLILA